MTSGREGAALVVRAEGRAPREDELEAMIEPWKRAALPGDRRRVGSGLGLFVARELIVAHGGRLSWEQAGPHDVRAAGDPPAREPPCRAMLADRPHKRERAPARKGQARARDHDRRGDRRITSRRPARRRCRRRWWP